MPNDRDGDRDVDAAIADVAPDATLGDLLRRAAGRWPDHDALIWGGRDAEARRRWSYRELLATAEGVAGALLDRVDPGERVALWAPNRPEWVHLQLGAALAGVVLVPLNPAFRPAEAADVLRRAAVAGVVYEPRSRGNDIERTVAIVAPELASVRFATSLDALVAEARGHARAARDLPAVTAGDTAQIQYTSGTTGSAKGVVLHHRGMTASVRLAVAAMQIGPAPVWLNVMPMFHIGGCGLSTIGPIALGGAQVLAERFDPALVLDLVEQEQVTFLGGVPTMLLALLVDPSFARRDLSSLRVVLSGGAHVAPQLVRHIEEALGVHFIVAYGQTETEGHAIQTRPGDSDDDKATTLGRPLPGVEVRISDPVTLAPAPANGTGEIWVRSRCNMERYFEDPAATAAAFGPGGWLRTGDLGSMDGRGRVRFAGRLKELINRGGENIHPPEIEAVLGAHDAVAEVAVVGVPDPHWGEQVGAVIRLRPGAQATGDELAAYVAERLSPHKIPRRWRFVEELPHTASGKVQKFHLREGWDPVPPDGKLVG